jgi:predicted metal-dependent HD superfamily phosphohydrolase
LKNSLIMLKKTFIDLAKRYSDDDNLIDELWQEIAEAYSHKDRHYHTLAHLDHLYARLLEVKSLISNWDTVLFSLYYHDIVYDVKASDNEEESAQLAEKRMKQLHVSVEIIETCKSQIIATKTHLQDTDSDTNYFTDADLSVLGQDWETYLTYTENVRKEYTIYPDLLYNPGRKKVLQHFLEMERIFKTEYFYEKLEAVARQNILKEIGFY